jgi:hypothetical protein
MTVKNAGEEPHICEVLRRLGKNEWSFSAQKDTLYTDFNGTWPTDDLVPHVIRNLNEKLLPRANEILSSCADKLAKVRGIFDLIAGYDIEELRSAEWRAMQEVPLIPKLEAALPYVHPTRIAFFTNLPQTTMDAYVVNRIRPLYYQNVPEGSRGRKLASVGTLYEEKNGKITGNVRAIPDDYARVVLQMTDILAPASSLAYLTSYPIDSNGLYYRF